MSTHPPINIINLADQEGLEIEFGDFSKPSVSGMLDHSKKIIYVKKDLPAPYQKYIIAKLLGEYSTSQNRSQKNSISEINGSVSYDDFAASLLMPKELVHQYWDILKSTKKMAYLFNVPVNICKSRLDILNLNTK